MKDRLNQLEAEHQQLRSQGLSLDLTRGKPARAQLDLAEALHEALPPQAYILQDGTDVRNYGGILGIPEARALGGDLLGMPGSNVLAGGNSSLTLMYQYVAMMMPAWQASLDDPDARVKFICLVPGYDRHFTICEHFGIEMISVPLLASEDSVAQPGDLSERNSSQQSGDVAEGNPDDLPAGKSDGQIQHQTGNQLDGPDMQAISKLVSADPSIKGVWCVPRHSNPTGHTYSEAVVKQFAELPKQAGEGFTVFWDNAYAVHHLTNQPPALANIFDLASQAGTESSIVSFASTSKITLAGAGISFMGTGTASLAAFEKWLGAQVIGFDKVNQLRHLRFLKDGQGIATHMKKHQAILKPKFDLVEAKLKQGLGESPDGLPIATWTKPQGGYFVSVNLRPGLASQVVQLALEAGVKLTPAGATYPYGKDPEDSNIRLAPSYPELDELGQAMDVFVTCVLLASHRAL